jgi:Flp pilus assembly protein TadD
MHTQDAGAAVGEGRGRGFRWDLVIPVVLVVGVLLCFSPAFSGELLPWDDQANFVDNTAWQGLGLSNLKWMATTFHMGHYQPLTWLSFGIQHAVGASGAGAMHVVNVLLHAVNAVLFFWLSRALMRMGFGERVGYRELTLAAGFAAALFALHPLRAESVAWVTERRDVLSTAFLVGAALAYLRSVEAGQVALRSKRWYWWTVVLLLLSCLCKAWGMSFFLVLLALDVWPLRRLIRETPGADVASRKSVAWPVVFEKWPMVLIGVVTAWVASLAQRGVFATKTLEQWTVTDRLVQACYGLWFYVRESVAPMGLSPLYQLPPHMEVGPNVVAIAFAVVLLGLILWCWKSRPAVSIALLIYVILISPVLGFVQSGEQIVADRYSYLATMPLAVLAAAGLVMLVRRASSQAPSATGEKSKVGVLLGALAGMAVAALALNTFSQAAVWRTPLSLWTHAAEVTPSPMVFAYQGDALAKAEKLDEARAAYEQALRLNPHDGRARFSWAMLMDQQGRTQQAEQAYIDAIPNLDTRRWEALERLSVIYWNRGQRDEAIKQIEQAMADVQRPGHKRPSGRPFVRMAEFKYKMGDTAASVAALLKAREYPDTRAEADNYLAQSTSTSQGNK